MRATRTSGSMSGDGKRAYPAPRPSSTLPKVPMGSAIASRWRSSRRDSSELFHRQRHRLAHTASPSGLDLALQTRGPPRAEDLLAAAVQRLYAGPCPEGLTCSLSFAIFKTW